MSNEKIYLKPGDLVVADNVLLMFDGKKYILTTDGLNPALKCIFDEETDQEYPIEYEVTENDIKPYYTKDLAEGE